MSEDGKFIYHLGIIDYLQDFNFDKWGENKLKGIIADKDLISSVPPKQYLNRYFKFMQSQVVINQESIDVTRKEVKLERIQKKFKKGSFKNWVKYIKKLIEFT